MRLSMRWAERCRRFHDRDIQQLRLELLHRQKGAQKSGIGPLLAGQPDLDGIRLFCRQQARSAHPIHYRAIVFDELL